MSTSPETTDSTITGSSTGSTTGSTITPCLWFDGDLEEAAAFYAGIFPRSSVGRMTRWGEGGPGEPGTVLAGEFTLDGLRFQGINGGPEFGFTEAVSFAISCRDQSEVDYYWDSLVDGGEESMCGWLKDRFGLSWQVVPTRLHQLLGDPDPRRARAATAAMMQMRRIVVADLEAAADAAAGAAHDAG